MVRGRALWLGGIAAAAALPVWAMEVTLAYKGRNHWVAEEDNAPLVKLMAQAAKGVRRYGVVLPEQERALTIERLEVLQRILAREAKGPVVLEEENGHVGANRIKVSTK